jgi:hypothetical protein
MDFKTVGVLQLLRRTAMGVAAAGTSKQLEHKDARSRPECQAS